MLQQLVHGLIGLSEPQVLSKRPMHHIATEHGSKHEHPQLGSLQGSNDPSPAKVGLVWQDIQVDA
eukprot:8298138-Prorocentrum_lima.AAC.1